MCVGNNPEWICGRRVSSESGTFGEVEIAGNAHDALTKLAHRSYDAIFLDVRMPDLDGLQLATVLRAFPRSLAVVFVSGFDTSASAAFELRAVDYLMKPVTAQRVDEALKRSKPAWPPVVRRSAVRSPTPPPAGTTSSRSATSARGECGCWPGA